MSARRRRVAAVLALTALLIAGASPSTATQHLGTTSFASAWTAAQWTDAAWTDAEIAAASASAATLSAPADATCVPTSVVLLGLQSVRLTWSSPQRGGQRVQFTRGSTTGTDTSQIVQTGASDGLYTYSATYTTAKLLGLVNLGDLLGGSYTIRVYNGYAGSEWLSPPRTFTLDVVLLGLGSTCT